MSIGKVNMVENPVLNSNESSSLVTLHGHHYGWIRLSPTNP